MRSDAHPTIGTDTVEFIRTAHVFDCLPPDERWLLAHTARAERHGRGAALFRQGAPATDVFLLRRGAVKLVGAEPQNDPFVVCVLGPELVFGMDTIAQGPVYTVTAETLSPSEVLVWRGATILRMVNDHPQFATELLQVLQDRLEDFRTRYRELVRVPVEQRLARALVRIGASCAGNHAQPTDIDLPVSRRDLADVVGTTIYTVSRILQRWHRCGLVQSGRMHLTIRDLARLRTEYGRVADPPASAGPPGPPPGSSACVENGRNDLVYLGRRYRERDAGGDDAQEAP